MQSMVEDAAKNDAPNVKNIAAMFERKSGIKNNDSDEFRGLLERKKIEIPSKFGAQVKNDNNVVKRDSKI